MSAPEPYRPSNSSEGQHFYSQWCDQCTCENIKPEADENKECQIFTDSLLGQVPEWVYKYGTPTCTAFKKRRSSVPSAERTRRARERAGQMSMFGGAP